MLLNISTIFVKEMRELLKDRRTLVLMIVLPTVVLPLLMFLIISMTKKATEKSATEKVTYVLVGEQNCPDLALAFSQNESFEKVDAQPTENLADLVTNDICKLVVSIPEGAQSDLETGKDTKVVLYFNNASATSRVERRAENVISEFSESIRDGRLIALGFDTSTQRQQLLEPVKAESRSTADLREILGERIGGMLPYFFIIFCFLGSLYPAIDLGAGEKERGTLETLLLTPVPRLHVVLGKFFVVFSTGLISSLMTVASLGVSIMYFGKEAEGVAKQILSSVQTIDLVMILVMLIPIAALFASILLSISIYGKSFKEAQSLATPLNFLCIIPAVLAMVPGVQLDWVWALVPITNVALAIKELAKGTIDYSMLWVILGSSTLIASGFLFFCTQWFQRESVLFRE
ncbi:MAG: ABC transporter permease [Acidobacteria bacterium]|nr:ABC transporter permease [Acidobacteriota bacterium]MCB9397201.1 ABC transporter permease [Acidobacteriota bacterium]